MSGFIALARTDGGDVDPALVAVLTDSQAFRGPDGRGLRVEGPVGLGHRALHSTHDAGRQPWPATLDGRTWLVADARVDDRARLRRELGVAGRVVDGEATDAALVLHSWKAWGIRCVEHLLGDFSFVLWDTTRRQIFAARDHFGIRPLYYARTGDQLALSNTLETLLALPGLSHTLDERAIGDFLLFGQNMNLASSPYAAIRRVPPAHRIGWRVPIARAPADSSGPEPHDGTPRRYWRLPETPVHAPAAANEVVPRFRALLAQAVADRLRTDHAAVFMSGGLDSTAVAALAHRHGGTRLHAVTTVYSRWIEDREREPARQAAQHLGIEQQLVDGADHGLFQVLPAPRLRLPEPVDLPFPSLMQAELGAAAASSRVVLFGSGGDPLLFPFQSHFIELLLAGRWSSGLQDAFGYMRATGERPPLYVRTWLRRRLRGRPPPPPMPDVAAAPDLATRLELTGRWAALGGPPPWRHRTHPEAYAALTAPFWPFTFETSDAGATGLPLEPRYPFFDLRLVSFVLQNPAFPWCVDKHVLRAAMSDHLPPTITARPKSVLGGDPRAALLPQGRTGALDDLLRAPGLAPFVDRDAARHKLRTFDPESTVMDHALLRPHSLGLWMTSRTPEDAYGPSLPRRIE